MDIYAVMLMALAFVAVVILVAFTMSRKRKLKPKPKKKDEIKEVDIGKVKVTTYARSGKRYDGDLVKYELEVIGVTWLDHKREPRYREASGCAHREVAGWFEKPSARPAKGVFIPSDSIVRTEIGEQEPNKVLVNMRTAEIVEAESELAFKTEEAVEEAG
jgi:hypothetical protein